MSVLRQTLAPPRWSEPFLVFLVFFLAQVATLSMAELFPGDNRLLIATIASGFCASISATVAVLWIDRRHGRRYLGGMHVSKRQMVSSIAAGALTSLAAWLLVEAFPADKPLPSLVGGFVENGPAIMSWWVLGLLVVAPVGEEAVFRGAVQGYVSSRLGKPFGIVIGALCFMVVHLPQLHGYWPAAVAIFAMGCVAGVARAWSGTIYASILVHAAYNTVAMAFVLAARF